MNYVLRPWEVYKLDVNTPFECELFLSNMIKDYIEPNFNKILREAFKQTLYSQYINDINILLKYDKTELVMNPNGFNSVTYYLSLPDLVEDQAPSPKAHPGIFRSNYPNYNMCFIVSSYKDLASKSLKIDKRYLNKQLALPIERKWLNCYFFKPTPRRPLTKEYSKMFKLFSNKVIPHMCDQWVSDCKSFLQLDISGRTNYNQDYFVTILAEEQKTS